MDSRTKQVPRSLGALVLGLSLVFLALGVARADGVVTTTATPATVDGTERFTVDVNVDETSSFRGAQFSLDYDTTYLRAVEIQAGDVWPVGHTFVAVSRIVTSSTSTTGTVAFAATILTDTQPVSGTLATVIFEAQNPSSTVTTAISNGASLPLALSDGNGDPLGSTAPPDLPITINPAPTVTGTVTLQAPGQDRQVTVNIASLLYQASGAVGSGSVFALEVPTGNGYTLTASAPCHLSAQTDASVAAPSGGHNTTLTAGDANGDNRVNIQDLAAIGSVFGQSGIHTCANMNGDGDGTVNILDLSLTASNYETTGPTLWP